jgi:hypothetical protein
MFVVSCAVVRGCYFLFALVHQRCQSQYGCVHLSKQQHFLLARLCYGFVDACPSRICCGDFVELRVVHFSSNRLISISLFVIQLPSVKAYSFQLRALSSSKHFCCTSWDGHGRVMHCLCRQYLH